MKEALAMLLTFFFNKKYWHIQIKAFEILMKCKPTTFSFEQPGLNLGTSSCLKNCLLNGTWCRL